MSGTTRTRTAAVTEQAAQSALRRGAAPSLAPAEERALRMRLGAAVPASAALERLAVASDAEIEVLAYEIEAWMRRRAQRGAAAVAARRPVLTTSRTKEKIVRALLKK